MYADDHQLYVKGYSVDCVKQILTDGGHTISKWYKENFLKGNYDKYNLILLGRKNKNEYSPSINVEIDEQVIKSSPDLKLLGVTLDDELSFSAHISDICKKASKSLENRRLKDILILMYKVKNSLAPEHVCNIFFQQDRHYNLRSDFPVPRHKLSRLFNFLNFIFMFRLLLICLP